MAYLAGWKDILRPIRDGYRHLFPSPDNTGPTPEEREKQRQLDRLKGFTYFDTFDQLESWTETHADPFQRANTPLLARTSAGVRHGEQRANVLICHDYSGNYHDYEAASVVGLDEEAYCCEYLQYVESFIYFSHKLVCVPPPTWTNTLHRNGVKVFGTVLIEPQTKESERLLRSIVEGKEGREETNFPLAKQLSDIARHYGFDGWLINIEKPFPQKDWVLCDLAAFLLQLKKSMGPSKELIWYDALTNDNKVAYQNGLNTKNIAFAATCGAVLTNYCWKESSASSSKEVASLNSLPIDKVYFGIDVWAQNTVNFGLPRTTYPETKGGGTNTGIAVAKLAEMGLSAGIFAPAWSFEHFPARGRSAEGVVWDGDALWDGAACSCRGEASYRHPDNLSYPITGSATQFCAGSENFFYTDFSRAFATPLGKEAERLYNGKNIFSQLGSQSILPHPSCARAYDGEVPIDAAFSRLTSCGGKPVLLVDAVSYGLESAGEGRPGRLYERDLPLFKLDMPADGSLRLTIPCAYYLYIPNAITSIYMKFTNGLKCVPLKDRMEFQLLDCVIQNGEEAHENARLQELGVRINSSTFPEWVDRILQIYEIRIAPRDYPDFESRYSIQHVRVERQGEGESEHWRLRWIYLDDRGVDDGSVCATSGVPYSSITGPFSYFTIQLDSVDLGRAYALDHVLPKALVDDCREGTVKVILVGVGFDGREIARYEQEDVRMSP